MSEKNPSEGSTQRHISEKQVTELLKDRVYEIGIQISEAHAIIRIDTARMRADLKAEAIRQGLSEAEAERISDTFVPIISSQTNQSELVRSIKAGVMSNDTEHANQILKLDVPILMSAADQVDKLNHRLLLTEPKMQFDILSLYSLFTKGTPHTHRLFFPRNLPEEYKPQYFRQLLDAMWRHERQHLIQRVKGPTKEMKQAHRRILEFRLKTFAAFTGAAFISGFAIAEQALTNPSALGAISISLVLALPLRYLRGKFNTLYEQIMDLTTGYELEAYAMMDAKHYSGTSPFSVVLEKTDPTLDPRDTYLP